MAIHINPKGPTKVIPLTVNLLLRIPEGEDPESYASDYISEMLSHNADIADWAYSNNAPCKHTVELPDTYEEGGFFFNTLGWSL